MKTKDSNPFIRRLKNLPSTIKNVSRMLWHPVRNLLYIVWHPIRNLFYLAWHPVRNLFYLAWHPVRNLFYVLWHPVRNLLYVVWHPIRNLFYVVWHPIRNIVNIVLSPVRQFLALIFSVSASALSIVLAPILGLPFVISLSSKIRSKWATFKTNSRKETLLDKHHIVESNILVMLACIPAAFIFMAKNTFIGKTILNPLMPKFGVFFQHKPKRWLNHFDNHDYQINNEAPAITIVTPSYGQAEFIGRTIDSVLDQAYPNLSYWVQDGGSSDGTVEILKKYSEKLTGWQSIPDNGQTHALNLAIDQIGESDIMAYLNSDDLYVPGAFAKVVDYFEKNPEVDVIYGNRLMVDENDLCIGSWVLHGHNSAVLSYADYVPQETMFWRRRIWDKIGGRFDESYRFAMDWDLILRFRAAGAIFLHVPEFLGAFRIHSAQKTQAIINEVGEQEMWRLRERELGFKPSDADIYSNILPFLVRHTIADFKLRYIDKAI